MGLFKTGLAPEDRNEFEIVFYDILKTVVQNESTKNSLRAKEYIGKMMNYNVPDGKKTRGLMVPLAYREFAKELNENDIHLSYILGWCVEIIQASSLIMDDLMDKSVTRRGKPCWYKSSQVEKSALVDGTFLTYSCLAIIEKYFVEMPYYRTLIKIFHDIIFKTTMGQIIDLETGTDLQTFSMERYKRIVEFKTSYYTFHLPVFCAMLVAGITEEEKMLKVNNILLAIGEFFQIQDDFLDCYGSFEVTGKVGTDIHDGKCSWLIVKALEKGTENDIEILNKCYGVDEGEEKVREVYEKLNMRGIYAQYEEEVFDKLREDIRKLPEGIPKQFFFDVVQSLFKRFY